MTAAKDGTRGPTSDVFNAIAEPRRREILTALRDGERTVTDLVLTLGLEQPQVSKHLRVIREVEAVSLREDGRLGCTASTPAG